MFTLTVSDGFLSATDAVIVTVQPVNHTPVAHAGPSITAQEGSSVILDGSRSSDSDGDTLTYNWIQTQGPR